MPRLSRNGASASPTTDPLTQGQASPGPAGLQTFLKPLLEADFRAGF